MLRLISASNLHAISSPSISSIVCAFELCSSSSFPPNSSLLAKFPRRIHHDPCNSRLSFTRFLPAPVALSSRNYRLKSLTASYTGSGTESKMSSETEREILVQHLLVKEDDHMLLLELQKRIAEGEDLSDLAVAHSICPSKEDGGMLGWVKKGQMVAEFEDAAFKAPMNKVVQCKTKFGWHLVQVISEREASVLEGITPSELHVKMQDPSFFEEAQLIDVREPEEVAKASLPGFQILPLREFGNWGPEITEKFDVEKDTFVLCHHGMRSLQVAKWLQMQGFRRVFNVSGGIHEYAVQADPTVPTY